MSHPRPTFLQIGLSCLFLLSLLAPAFQPVAAEPVNALFSQPVSIPAQITSGVPAPDIVVDGVIDAEYGSPLAVDPAGDGNGSPVMDLLELYAAEDADNFYFAFTVNADIDADNWGKYAIYIDTTNDSNGALFDAWGRNVTVDEPHEPEYGLYSWVDCPVYNASCTQFWGWGGGSWSQSGSLDEAALGAGTVSILEWRVAKTRLGSPSNFWLEVWDTGGNPFDNAQDTINDPPGDWDAADWTSPSHLLVSSAYPSQQPVQLSLGFPPEGYYTVDADLDVAGVATPATGVTVTVAINQSDFYTPAIDPSGAFTQTVALTRGQNTIEVTATDGENEATLNRTVDYGGAHDGHIVASQLLHDSRDSLYRTPGGPVPVDTVVTLRLRAASGDLTEAIARVWDDRQDVQYLLDMDSVLDDGTYEWWQVSLPASADTTVYWYRFIVEDGSAEEYYEDDSARTGGVGEVLQTSQDRSWQLTMYSPDFHTPDWLKNAVVYQVFPDRFRDGDPTNDTPPGTFFYDEEGGTIARSNTAEWNTYICDPRQEGTDCTGTYSKNFYGGDLQGLIDKLDYLQELGVTAIYLNPIFESPSNHKYDTTDYSVIDDAFGDQALFTQLVSAAGSRGIHLILDGVFNHTSSDSLYFDRYSRYPQVGACESPVSPYRDWYFFADVPPGTGTCAGSDGTPNAATYTSWFGYDSLPKLNSANQQVRDLIWANGTASIAPGWVEAGAEGWRLDVAGDIDPGTINDPNNDYWEGFRGAVHAVNPETYIVGEEWGYASSWTLGGEWDATMNYQFSSAVLSFWRDEPFVDNDHNSGSSAGVLNPLTPTQLDERLLNLQERYAPEAFYAMLNLLDSHDTNRALFMLDHNAALGTDDSPLQDPNYDWSDSITRLKGVVLLQMTLPGAPTIYYGDEVGLVGPVTYDGSTWQDDPYNRQPYPWLDESGTPFYTHLQSQGSQDALHDYYELLTSARNSHPALRTGDFKPLLVDDERQLYAYSRIAADHSDAAVVILNRAGTIADPTPQSVTLDLSGLIPSGATFTEVLSGDVYSVDGSGQVTVDVPGESGAVLVLTSGAFSPPGAVIDLAVTAEGAGELDLGWSAAPGASSYLVYRSLFSGGGYQLAGETSETSFTDSGLTNALTYYYVVVSRADATGLLSGYSNEASGIPHYTIDWADLDRPAGITHIIGLTPTVPIYGQVFIDGVTSVPGAAESLEAQLGFGPKNSSPATWTDWVEATFSGEAGENDEFVAQLLPEYTGDYNYLYRYTTTGGRDWVYAGLSAIKFYLPGIFHQSSGGTSRSSGQFAPTPLPELPGLLHVIPSDDTVAPATPQNLRVEDFSTDFVRLAWDPVSDDPSLYAYDIFRSEIPGEVGVKIARVLAPTAIYTDTALTSGATYDYVAQALDTSFNRSDYSNQVSVTPVPKKVAVTFNVTVPPFTPGTVYFTRQVNDDGTIGGWDPAGEALTRVDDTTFTGTFFILDKTTVEFKFARGTWDMVEKEADGNTEIPNRSLIVDYGSDGTQIVDLTVANWRDPIVADFTPELGATGVPTDTVVSVIWSQAMPPDTSFSVSGPGGEVAGTFTYDEVTYTVVFTPAAPLDELTTYTVSVSGVHDIVGDSQQVPVVWSFTTGG